MFHATFIHLQKIGTWDLPGDTKGSSWLFQGPWEISRWACQQHCRGCGGIGEAGRCQASWLQIFRHEEISPGGSVGPDRGCFSRLPCIGVLFPFSLQVFVQYMQCSLTCLWFIIMFYSWFMLSHFLVGPYNFGLPGKLHVFLCFRPDVEQSRQSRTWANKINADREKRQKERPGTAWRGDVRWPKPAVNSGFHGFRRWKCEYKADVTCVVYGSFSHSFSIPPGTMFETHSMGGLESFWRCFPPKFTNMCFCWFVLGCT